MPTSPVPLVDGSSHWQLHASSQHHASVQQQHGNHGMDGSDGACCERPLHTSLLTRCSDQLASKTKVDEIEAAKPMGRSATSCEHAFHTIGGAAIITWGRVVCALYTICTMHVVQVCCVAVHKPLINYTIQYNITGALWNFI